MNGDAEPAVRGTRGKKFAHCVAGNLVTNWPSLDQMTPEPEPLPPACTKTVERRSCSAISPNPGMAPCFAMLCGSVRTLADDDAGFLERAAADKFHRKRFAD